MNGNQGTQYEQIREFLLEALKPLFASTTISLWFEPMQVIGINNDSITVSLPSNRKIFVESKYFSVLQQKCNEVLGFDLPLKLVAEEEAYSEPELPEKQENFSAYKYRFNPSYTFANFVIGKSNQLAQAASYAVSLHPAELNNPLYLYGPSGLGKTHLLFAIINKLRETHPDYNLLYVTGEEFTNEFVESLANKTSIMLREKYRNLDVLLVDDIQFIGGKERIQEEFFHTFDTLYKLNKQIILASDCHPRDIDNLDERLTSRFEMGLTADIQPPDHELRIAIFKRKAIDYDFDLSFEVLSYLADNITINIRQIEGSLKRLKAHCLMTGNKCDLDTAKLVLSGFFKTAKSESSTIDRIFEYVQKRYGVSKEVLKSAKRSTDIAFARHVAVYLVRQLTNLSLKGIAKLFSRKDHTTIINSISEIERRMQVNSQFEKEIAQALAELREN